MNEDAESLIDLAYQAEKYGDRSEAIRLYRQVADGDSEHATYALNCAKNLEQFGLPTPAETKPAEVKIAETKAAEVETLAPESLNPFRSPQSTDNAISRSDYSNERRMHLTANIIRALAMFCLLTGLYSWLTMYIPFDLTAWQQWMPIAGVEFLTIAWWFVAAWLCGSFAAALQNLLPLSADGLQTFTRRQLRLWIGLGMLASMFILREMATYWIIYY